MPSTTITFKTLNQKTFKIEIDDEEKVSQLKKKIHEEKGDEFPVDQQRLIHTGKILADETVIKDCGIDPVKTFVVIMAIKPKPVPGAPAQASSSAPLPVVTTAAATATVSSVASSTAVSAPSATSASGEVASTASTTESSTTQSSVSDTSTTSDSQITSAESQLVTGSAQETTINELMTFGFSREQCQRAMQRSFNNPDRAAEILLSGAADSADDALGDILSLGADTGDDVALDQVLESADNSSTSVAALPGQDAPPVQETGDLAFLRHLPQFEMMRRNIQANPGALPGLLQELGRSNQQLLTLISNNQQEFIAMLNEPIDGDAGGAGDAAGGAGGGPSVQVTQEEKAKIDNMVSMGFSEHEVVQAFFACDKDESLAVNLLMDGMMDD